MAFGIERSTRSFGTNIGGYDMYKDICKDIKEAGGKAYLVGGYVRDYLLNVSSNDIDMEVFGLSRDEVYEILSSYGEVIEVGKTKVFSLHNNVEVSVAPSGMTPETRAFFKRDLTINAIYFDPLGRGFVDTHGGMKHLREKKLRSVSGNFVEDPLRTLRVARFMSLYAFVPDKKMKEYAKETAKEYSTIPKENIWEEWKKIMLADNPVMALEWLFGTEWSKFYPDLEVLKTIEQDSNHHPEGNVWEHTMYALDYAAQVTSSLISHEDAENTALSIRFATLLHDVGKVSTTEVQEDGRITSYGHDVAGVEYAERFLKSIGAPEWLIDKVLPLVQEHMFTVHCKDITLRTVRRLSRRLEPATIWEWYDVTMSDKIGRPGREDRYSNTLSSEVYEIAKNNEFIINPIKPIVMGRHLLEIGYEPGREMGRILKVLFEAQLDGEFNTVEEGLAWYKKGK